MAEMAQPDVDWNARWEGDRIGWHRSEFNASLTTFHHLLVQGSEEERKTPLRVLVPLCGKSIDMLWLADQGHSVIGVDLVEKAVAEFVADNKLEAKQETVVSDEGVSFPVHTMTATKGTISLYTGDLFKANRSVVDEVDFIFDRGSFVAIGSNLETRHKYASHVTSLLKPGGRILMEHYVFLPEEHAGPPFPVTDEELQVYFGANYEIQLLLTQCAMKKIQGRFLGIKTKYDLNTVLLTRKP